MLLLIALLSGGASILSLIERLKHGPGLMFADVEFFGLVAFVCAFAGGLAVFGARKFQPVTKIFFYGLFMNRSLLVGKGLHPEIIGPAVLPGYRIHIGERATLLRSASSRAFGIVMQLKGPEARALYSEPSVREYMREGVRVELLDTGESVEAYCYNLPAELALSGANPAYATELSRLVEALEFDSAYVDEIAAFGKAP
jgi:hypothetical protein